ARRHPWSVSLLDAASGLLRPGSLLRNKILLMAAILETSPAFADEFLPRDARPLGLLLALVAHGTVAVARAALGAVVYAAAVRSGRCAWARSSHRRACTSWPTRPSTCPSTRTASRPP